MMGTKKAVLSETMGLKELYDDGERRCERPAVEWSVDSKMQRKIRVKQKVCVFLNYSNSLEVCRSQILRIEETASEWQTQEIRCIYAQESLSLHAGRQTRDGGRGTAHRSMRRSTRR